MLDLKSGSVGWQYILASKINKFIIKNFQPENLGGGAAAPLVLGISIST